MGVFGYIVGKVIVGTATAVLLVSGTAAFAVCPPAGAALIAGAEAGAAMLVSPVDPVSTTTAVLTTAV